MGVGQILLHRRTRFDSCRPTPSTLQPLSPKSTTTAQGAASSSIRGRSSSSSAERPNRRSPQAASRYTRSRRHRHRRIPLPVAAAAPAPPQGDPPAPRPPHQQPVRQRADQSAGLPTRQSEAAVAGALGQLAGARARQQRVDGGSRDCRGTAFGSSRRLGRHRCCRSAAVGAACAAAGCRDGAVAGHRCRVWRLGGAAQCDTQPRCCAVLTDSQAGQSAAARVSCDAVEGGGDLGERGSEW